MDSVLDAVLPLDAASVNTPSAIEIEPVPDCVAAVGVKVAVYEVPLPVNPLKVPPDTVTSVEMKFVEVSDSVNVMVSVWPDRKDVDPARVMVTVGTSPSTR